MPYSYGRRIAVLAIFTIYKNFDFLIPDSPELISKFLDVDQVNSLGDILQFVRVVHINVRDSFDVFTIY